MVKRLKNERGLTLVELLAVVVILGIIAAIAVPSIGMIIENSKKDAAVSNAQQILNAAQLYKAGTSSVDGDLGHDQLKEYLEGDGIINPWDASTPITEYSVTLNSSGSNEVDITFPGKCTISGTSQQLTSKGRDACGS
ncbi:type II secretion system protein [Alkalihalobacillus trypoxylicola]|uniref:type II secretion system protein n=1 Tax=Alkalihalobacillus trypoxylicola TaxID=519424 RepID=UPI0009ED9188|nr:type II secretion system protein [Alkalihalobacillus trypoxylicola]